MNTDTHMNVMLTVERGLEVLRDFRAAREPLSNAEIGRRTGFPKATVSRLTTTLIAEGYLIGRNTAPVEPARHDSIKALAPARVRA
ncbi:helix-turn-helix domain-containing protein [Paraburkholderia bannensis]|uniref:helix-turn-helix domain-containing protein n=1 Tax=Paraburkholderia bannensis TaxID=765414 RepID=UPI0004853FCD|nr:helix-turn-helix domain-containing protein [Paraburkholderia bannensis]